mgnify:CR=1 FL=1
MLALLIVALLTAPSSQCWRPPVDAPIVDPYREPGCRWCPGNRGVTYGPAPGSPVRAVASGVVSFAGTVAGTRYVVVALPDGRRVTYGDLASSGLTVGRAVVAGQVIGRSSAVLHLGLRIGDRYVDPTPLIGRWVGRPRLIPADGGPPRPAPPPRLRCRVEPTSPLRPPIRR